MPEASVLLNAAADALNAAASTLRQHAIALSPQVSDGQSLSAVERARVQHPQLGPRQAEAITLLEPLYPEGTDTGYLYREMDYDQPNVYLTLQGLIKLGIVEKNATTRPHTYRLHPDFMRNEE
jgi:hypothetical protein